MWKQSDFRNLLKWSLGFFKEDSDKPSQTIDGSSSITITAGSSATLQSNNANYIKL